MALFSFPQEAADTNSPFTDNNADKGTYACVRLMDADAQARLENHFRLLAAWYKQKVKIPRRLAPVEGPDEGDSKSRVRKKLKAKGRGDLRGALDNPEKFIRGAGVRER